MKAVHSAASWNQTHGPLEIEVTDIHLQSDLLDVSADRIFLAYLDGQFKSLFPISSGVFPVQELNLSKGERKWWDKKREVHITVQLRRGATEGSVHDAMNEVFLRSDEHVSNVVPPFWKPFLGVTNADIAQKTTDGVPSQPATSAVPVTQGPSSGASAPHVQYQPDPEYSELARQARYHGTVVLSMIVNVAGRPTGIRIVRPLGLGLDEKAVETVSRWKFAPAMKDGNPVAVQINVEIEFRLY
jgi:TonB family protein